MRIFPHYLSTKACYWSARMCARRRAAGMRPIDGLLHLGLLLVIAFLLLHPAGTRGWSSFRSPQTIKSSIGGEATRYRTMYRGFRTGNSWQVVVARPGHPMRLLDRPRRPEEWPLAILTDYLGDRDRAADIYREFASLTIDHFSGDWELTGKEIDNALLEVELHRTHWRSSLIRT